VPKRAIPQLNSNGGHLKSAIKKKAAPQGAAFFFVLLFLNKAYIVKI
jgi:hypothetical protein